LHALPVILIVLGLYVGGDEFRKPYVQSNCYARQGRWDEVLDLSLRLPKGRTNVFVNHDIIRALYHTGRLPYDMFRYPQVPEAILLTHERRESDLTQAKLADLFLELGHVNMAEKLASELLTARSHHPFALEKLGWISIIKGCPRTAEVYLRALRKDLIYGRTASSLIRALDTGFTDEQTDYIGKIRSYMREQTAVTGSEPVDQTLKALLEHNPDNRMAFEYLMACYLLTGRVDQIAASAGRLSDLGYGRIPTLYEEAILIYRGSGGQDLDLAGLGISQETLDRYQRFVQTAGTIRPENRQAVLGRLIREFGTGYFFYYSFGRVGVM
jgi:hypothetical protein